MKIIFLFYVLASSFSAFSQYKAPIHELYAPSLDYSDNDSTRIYSFEDFDSLKLVSYIRREEYFVARDTLHRDFIQINSQRFIVDKMLCLDHEYTVNYDLIQHYSIGTEDVPYMIFEGGDTFPLGTNQQVTYIILVLDQNGWKFHSSYENEHNMPTDDIKVRLSKNDNLTLKGKYLSRITR